MQGSETNYLESSTKYFLIIILLYILDFILMLTSHDDKYGIDMHV
jgi:hypothetical protein